MRFELMAPATVRALDGEPTTPTLSNGLYDLEWVGLSPASCGSPIVVVRDYETTIQEWGRRLTLVVVRKSRSSRLALFSSNHWSEETRQVNSMSTE